MVLHCVRATGPLTDLLKETQRNAKHYHWPGIPSVMVHSYGGSPDGMIQIQKAAQKPGGKGTQKVKVAFGFTAGMLANRMAKKARFSA